MAKIEDDKRQREEHERQQQHQQLEQERRRQEEQQEEFRNAVAHLQAAHQPHHNHYPYPPHALQTQ